MTENASTTELTSQYTAQVTADLERNTKEQERLSGEIAALNEQLAAHQRDHAVLVSIQQAIGTVAPVPAVTVQPSGTQAVPAPRKKATAKSTTGKRTPPKKTAPAKPAPAKADKAESSKPAQPTVVDLVRGHLAGQSEPRSAAEITTALGQRPSSTPLPTWRRQPSRHTPMSSPRRSPDTADFGKRTGRRSYPSRAQRAKATSTLPADRHLGQSAGTVRRWSTV